MERVDKVIEVSAPLHAVYDQWTRFEEFPRFVPTLFEVRKLDDTHVHWEADLLGHDESWDAEITEQVPDKRISWRSSAGRFNAGTVRFEAIDAERTRVRLSMAFEPDSFLLSMFETTGLITSQIHAAMVQFKDYMESRGRVTGDWYAEPDAPLTRVRTSRN
jgi:uncharacterized membrane protein